MREKMKMGLLLIVLFSSLYSDKFVFAEPNVQRVYSSNGEVEFYGKYEYPKEVVPPIESKPIEPSKPLPQTGVKSQRIFMIIGGILVLVSFLGIKKIRKTTNLILEENKK